MYNGKQILRSSENKIRKYRENIHKMEIRSFIKLAPELQEEQPRKGGHQREAGHHGEGFEPGANPINISFFILQSF